MTLEKEITNLVEELYEISIDKLIRSEFQYQMNKDQYQLDIKMEELDDSDKDVDDLKLIQLQAEELAANIKLLEKGLGTFNILTLPALLYTKTRFNVVGREEKVNALQYRFKQALKNQLIRIKKVENKFPGINEKNGHTFNLFLLENEQAIQDKIEGLL